MLPSLSASKSDLEHSHFVLEYKEPGKGFWESINRDPNVPTIYEAELRLNATHARAHPQQED